VRRTGRLPKFRQTICFVGRINVSAHLFSFVWRQGLFCLLSRSLLHTSESLLSDKSVYVSFPYAWVSFVGQERVCLFPIRLGLFCPVGTSLLQTSESLLSCELVLFVCAAGLYCQVGVSLLSLGTRRSLLHTSQSLLSSGCVSLFCGLVFLVCSLVLFCQVGRSLLSLGTRRSFLHTSESLLSSGCVSFVCELGLFCLLSGSLLSSRYFSFALFCTLRSAHELSHEQEVDEWCTAVCLVGWLGIF